MLRKEIADGTELGQNANKFISVGQLVPDDVIIGMIANKLDTMDKNAVNGIILDGFPRTLAQAEALEKMLEERGEQTEVLVDLDVKEDELINRLLMRGQTSGRSDDNLETIQKRLNVYHNLTQPLIEYYDGLHILKEVDGTQDYMKVFDDIVAILG